MSATILDPKQICVNTGITLCSGRTYEYRELTSPFPKENRPVYFEPCANVINKEMELALPKLARGITEILSNHPDERILIHTVSYRIRDYIRKNVATDRFITHTTADRAAVLEKFKSSSKPLVLLTPSMDRGVDLPDDACRVVVIAKVPYPDLTDPQIGRRLHASKDGNSWYAHRTVSTIIQMSGRGVRSATDYATTYILDAQFERIYREYKYLFPAWFREAVVM